MTTEFVLDGRRSQAKAATHAKRDGKKMHDLIQLHVLKHKLAKQLAPNYQGRHRRKKHVADINKYAVNRTKTAIRSVEKKVWKADAVFSRDLASALRELGRKAHESPYEADVEIARLCQKTENSAAFTTDSDLAAGYIPITKIIRKCPGGMRSDA